MKEIIIYGKSGEFTKKYNNDYFNCNINDLIYLDGVDCQDCFSDYLDDRDLRDKIEGGYMSFYVENNKPMVEVSYKLKEDLTDDEIHDLIKYTTGQMSDGIGEGFEQYPFLDIDGTSYFISPWFHGQKLKYKIIEQ